MRRVLKPDGVLVINTFAKLEGDQSFFGGSLQKTLAAAFSNVRIHGSWNGNTFFVASARTPLSFVNPAPMDRVLSGVKPLVDDAYTRIREADPMKGIVLTDDFNPVEYFDAPNREETRRRLVENGDHDRQRDHHEQQHHDAVAEEPGIQQCLRILGAAARRQPAGRVYRRIVSIP